MLLPLRPLSLLLAVFISYAAPLAANDDTEVKPLVYGFISTESTTQLRKGFDPLVARLSQELDITIKSYYATDYAGVIEAMRFDQVDLAWCGAKAAIEAVDRSGAEVFAQLTKADGNQGYRSVIIVHRDSPIGDIEQAMGRGKELTFGNGDPNSTSGFLIPSYYLWAPRGINPRTFFKRSRNANHEANCIGVAMKQIDLATANSEALSRLALTRPKLADQLRVVWESPIIPNDPIIWRANLPHALKERIRAALISLGREEPEREADLAMLTGIQDGWGTFLPSSNDQLLPIRELLIERDIMDVANDPRLDDAEKEARLAELAARQSELKAQRSAIEASASATPQL